MNITIRSGLFARSVTTQTCPIKQAIWPISIPDLCLLTMLIHGCGAATRELEQVNAQQANTETMVKAALIDEQGVNAASIQVSMDRGAIVLSGFVGTQADSDTAERLARQGAQELSVINSLEIR